MPLAGLKSIEPFLKTAPHFSTEECGFTPSKGNKFIFTYIWLFLDLSQQDLIIKAFPCVGKAFIIALHFELIIHVKPK
jgi:hypothetical protein